MKYKIIEAKTPNKLESSLKDFDRRCFETGQKILNIQYQSGSEYRGYTALIMYKSEDIEVER